MRNLIFIFALIFCLPLAGQIPVNTPFEANTNNALDNRLVQDNLSDTASIVFKYDGMLVYFKDVSQLWTWKGSWEEFSGGVTDGDKGGITVSNAGSTWAVKDSLFYKPFRRVVIDTAGNISNRSDMPSAVMVGTDSIYLIYQQFPGATGDQAVSYIVGRLSTDGGYSWSNASNIIVNDHPGLDSVQYGAQNPSLLYRGDTLHMVFLGKEKIGEIESTYDGDHYYVYSTNMGVSWSSAVKITTDAEYYAPASDRLYDLNGRLIYVTTRAILNDIPANVISCSDYTIDIIESADGGATWTKTETGVQPPGGFAGEPGLVILEDGTWMLYMRTCDNYVYQSYSSNQGATWTVAEKTQLASTNSQSTIEKILPKQDLVAAFTPENYKQSGINNNFGDNEYKRRRLYLATSANDGYTWEPSLELFSGTPENPLAFEPTLLYDEKNNKLHVYVSEDMTEGTPDSYELVVYIVDYDAMRVSTLDPNAVHNAEYNSVKSKIITSQTVRDSSYMEMLSPSNTVSTLDLTFFDNYTSDANGSPRIRAITNSVSSSIPALRIVPFKNNGFTNLAATDKAFTVQIGVNEVFAVRGNGDVSISGSLTQLPPPYVEINPTGTGGGLELSRSDVASGSIKWRIGTGGAGTFWPFKEITPVGPYSYQWRINQTASSSTQTLMDWEFQTVANGNVVNSILHRWTNNGALRFSINADGIVNIFGGIRINNLAPSGEYLRGNGTNFVSSAILEADLPDRPISAVTGLEDTLANLQSHTPILRDMITKTANFTAKMEVNLVDISAGSVTVTAPATPSIGDCFSVRLVNSSLGGNTCTVEMATDKYLGETTLPAASHIINTVGGSATFQYVNITTGWTLKSSH